MSLVSARVAQRRVRQAVAFAKLSAMSRLARINTVKKRMAIANLINHDDPVQAAKRIKKQVKTARPSKWSIKENQTLIYNNYFAKEKVAHKETGKALGRTDLAVRIELCRVKKNPDLLQPLFEYWWDQNLKHTQTPPEGVRLRDPATIEAADNLLSFAQQGRKQERASAPKTETVGEDRPVKTETKEHKRPAYIYISPYTPRELDPNSFHDQGLIRIGAKKLRSLRNAYHPDSA